MSEAHKCDRCGSLYVPEKGTVTLDQYHVIVRRDNRGQWWSTGYNAELCKRCSKYFLEFIKHGQAK